MTPRLRFAALLFASVLATRTRPARGYETEGEPLRLRPPVPHLRFANQDFTGYFFIGGFLYNRDVPARPDNTGAALLRFGEHLDLDLVRRYLTLTYNANFVIDAETVALTTYGQVIGLRTFIPVGHGFALRADAAYRYDRPLDAARTDHVQTCLVTAARVQYDSPRMQAFLSLGALPWNASCPARPDNTGLALLRARARVEVDVHSRLALRADLSAITDGDGSGGERALPSEVDAALEAVLHLGGTDLRLIGEVDSEVRPASPAARARALSYGGDSPGRRVLVEIVAEFPFDLRAWWKTAMR